MVDYLSFLVWLLMTHFLCDYVLQTDSIANGKNKTLQKSLFGVHWTQWMTAHASCHAIGAALISYLFIPSLEIITVILVLEFLFHWGIDYAKCVKKISLTSDQLLHIFCKTMYAGFLLM